MHSDLIGKIEKARRYAEEPERIKLSEIKARFNGGNSEHEITLADGHWSCTCSFFHSWRTCAHVMAMQRIMNPMLTDEARQAELAIPAVEETVS
ncbi:MAG: hypothetical protein HC822_16085 [Oscillochloris sp.]|nr:hypothetical protein [Oscillochloris sp.]